MRVLIRLCLALIMFGVCGRAGFAAFPDRAIHIVVPFPPGGPVGVVAHIVAPRLAERLGQSVNIDNVAGDDGIKGSDLVAKAPPDGYTLLLASSTHTIHPGTYSKLPFDTEKAFAPVSLLRHPTCRPLPRPYRALPRSRGSGFWRPRERRRR